MEDMVVDTDVDLRKWGIPLTATPEQRAMWANMVKTWRTFSGKIPEPSLDIGAASDKGRTVSVDPYPRGRVDIRAIGENLPFIDCYFASVVLESVLKHVLSPTETLEETYRVLREGGLLFLTSPVNHIDSHRHSFLVRQLCLMIENSGFRIIRKMGLGFSFNLLDGNFRRRASRFYSNIKIPIRFCRTLYVVAEKNSR
jgi:SAM-dependent methyltransferase